MTDPSERPGDPIRLAVIDDHPAIVAAIRQAADDAGDVRVVATAATLEGAIAAATGTGPDAPDVVLCDVQLAGEAEGLRLVERLAVGGTTRPPVILLSSFDAPALLRAAFEKGAAGYVVKTAEVDAILAAVRTVAAGGTAFSADALRAVRTAPRRPSDRELEVLALVCGGASNDEIGAALGLSEKTVESHLRRLFDRYGVLSRTELAVLAVREGWVRADTTAG